MSLFEDASLITTPNAYKAGKLYSIKPTNGDGDLDVVRATTATRVNSAGLIETVANNVPRLDYTGGSCPSILVEPQRTNLLLRSEEFDNASWNKSGASVIANQEVSPDGNTNADEARENSATGVHVVFKGGIGTISTIETSSIFAKPNGRDWIAIQMGSAVAYFNISDGTIGTVTGGYTAKIKNYGNGWYRCSITGTRITNQNNIFYIASDNNANNYMGDGVSGVFLWGAQLEEGSNATSYIPTVASAVTRNEDVISKTGIADLINSSEGVFYGEINAGQQSSLSRYISISDGTTSNRVIFGIAGSTNNLTYFVSSSGTVATGSTSIDLTQTVKCAVKYKQNDFALWVNGVEVSTDSLGASPVGLSVLAFNQGNVAAKFYGKVKNLQVFKTALTNAQLEALTTL